MWPACLRKQTSKIQHSVKISLSWSKGDEKLFEEPKPLCQISNSSGKQTRRPQASPTWWLCTLSNLIFYNLILNPEWKEKGEPTCNTTIINTGNNINDCDFCTYQNNEDHWSQTDFHRDSEDSLVARFRQHAACRVSNSLSHFKKAIISFHENQIKHAVTEVLQRCYRLRWEFSSTAIHSWNTVWRTEHVLILNIVLLITSSAFNPGFQSQNRSVYWC